ncbi:strawberry notch C-terminal domain-containing protein [Mesorhizobium sp. LNHC229A00]|uniref:strawberry notch C-terminal domain-containing protein n=1 Tax=Mesorhizobium sp. LNHC229A00 TaxID=1287240 RepID=UPI0003CF4E8E|nr:strawberry notch C-terminal domain-containing protein [Mesorhizobium sp. LNHC229A00]ESY91810.1 methylase [Mesorhizobium sp. LNHC229A00]
MNIVTTTPAAPRTASHLAAQSPAGRDKAQAVYQAGMLLLPFLKQGKPVATAALRTAMTTSFGGTDAQGFWIWKDAYDALEAAQVLFLRRFGPAILSQSTTPQATLAMMKRIAELLPTHTRRSDESQAMQQLSTPLPLAFVTALAAAMASSDLVLEPSAGTGLLAVHAEMARASLALNELAATRADLLGLLFPRVPVSRYDAAHIDDHLDVAIEPSVVLMNPPFSVAAYVDGHVADAAWRHFSSAFARLRSGGRLVAITGTGLSPENPKWRPAFERLQQQGTVIFTAAIDGRVYARHGTTVETRLTVIDKVPNADPSRFPASPGKAPDVETLLSWITDLPPRTPGGFPDSIGALSNGILRNAAMRMAARSAARAAPVVASPAASRVTWPVRAAAQVTPVRPVMASSTPALPLAYELRDCMPEEGGRLVKKIGRDGIDRLAVENRPGSANLAETQSFMDDHKRELIFSDAGGTGRSYHADLGAKNQRLRKHYLLEAGWRADNAIQGLGRTHRTNQAQPPVFRPTAANVKAGKRFLSTIARRLDTLGAITRGQRQTGGAGLFRAEDNLESPHARAALRQFYHLLRQGKIEGCSLTAFEAVTGLSLTTEEGGLRDELPPITTWLNRLLALRIDTQNLLFEVFEQLMTARIEGAIAAGSYDKGLETITAESIVVTDRRTVYTHPVSGAQSHVLTVARKDRIRPLSLVDALAIAQAEPQSILLVNTRSSRAAIQLPTASLMLDDGTVEHRVRLLRPTDELRFGLGALAETHWQPTERNLFCDLWETEVAAVPEFTTSIFHIVTGLLLPIWRRLPDDDCRVYRIQTNAGERIIGRHIAPTLVATLFRNLGIDHVPTLSTGEAWAGLLRGRIGLQLADGLILRRSRVMNDYRVELIGFTDAMVPRLKALGLMSEIISWKLRLFIPTAAQGSVILAALFERHTLVGVTDRTAAA